jgi:hypothetical protein
MGDFLHLSLNRLGLFNFLVWVTKHRLRVLQNWVLRVLFGSKGEELTGVWRKMHREDLRDLHSLPTVSTSIKSNMGWACGMNRTERNAYRTLVGKAEGDLLENLCADWRIILKWAVNWMGNRGPDFYLAHE